MSGSFSHSMGPMEIYGDIFEFAASAGALEGYVFKKDALSPEVLDDWIRNLVKQYHDFSEDVRTQFQGSLDRTMGRTVHSLIQILGPDHQHVLVLKSLIVGEMPSSFNDFKREKEDKAGKYGN